MEPIDAKHGSLALTTAGTATPMAELTRASSKDGWTFDSQSITLVSEEDPRNWSASQKWGTTAIISLMGFISPLGSAVVVPGSALMDREFTLRSRELSLLPVSFFVLGLGVGPFLLAPASELKGRRPIFVASCLIFVLFNVSTALVRNFAALCFLRFMAGAAGSTGPSLGAGSIGDLFAPRERGRAQSLYGLGPLLGPVCGAIAGGWLAQSLRSWRWLLWFLTILSGFIAVVVTALLQETYAPVLLRRKTQRLAREHLRKMDEVQVSMVNETERRAFEAHRMNVHALAYPNVSPYPLHAEVKEAGQVGTQTRFATKSKILAQRLMACCVPGRELRDRTRLALSRPFRLLFLNPICALFSLYMGFIYGIIFIFLTQHPLLFERRESADDPPPTRLPTYGWSPGLASLTYLGLGLGFLVAASINVLLQDAVYARLVLTGGRIGWNLFYNTDDIITDVINSNHRRATGKRNTGADGPDIQAERRSPNDFDVEKQTPDLRDGEIIDVASSSAAIVSKRAACDEKLKADVQAGVNSATDGHQTGSASNAQHSDAVADAGAVGTSSRAANSRGKGRPEFRLPLCLVGMTILPCGLLIFGWTAHAHTHFMLPLLGSFFVGVGSIMPFQAILVYLVDAFIPYSASATACAVLVRCILAAVFPLFSQKLFVALGFGWGSSLLALISVIAIPLPVILFYKGESLRQRFRFEG